MNDSGYFRLFVCGPGGVGKTASITQFVQNHFLDDYGYYNDYPDETFRKQCSINDRTQDQYNSEENYMFDQYVRTAQFCYIIFSMTSRTSFNEVEEFFQRIIRVKDPPTDDLSSLCILVGNKGDREYDFEVADHEPKELAKKYNCLYFQTSARTRVNIEEAFFSCWTQHQKGLFSDEDKVVRLIPTLSIPEYTSRLRDNIASCVDRAPHSDLLIESDDWEKFKMVCMLINFSQEGLVYENEYWVPREVWLIIKDYLLYHKFFTTRYRFYAHKCIMLARFPTLMDFIKEHKINMNLPQNFEPQAMRDVLTYIYCGNLHNTQPNNLKAMLPIAKKLKLYNLVAICEGRGHQPPVQKPLSFELLTNSEALSDFKFAVKDNAGTKYIPVHKVLLYNQCHWVSQKFHDANSNVVKDEILIDGSYELNLEFFKFLYEDCISDNLPLNTLFELAKLSQTRYLATFSEYLHRKISQMLTYETAIPISRYMTSNSTGSAFNDYCTLWIGYRVAIMKQRDEWKQVPSDMKERWERIRVRGRWKEAEDDKKEKCIIS